MTKKDYELIARGIKLSHNNWLHKLAHKNCAGLVANSISGLLSVDNPRFDRNKFLEACGLDSEAHYCDENCKDNNCPIYDLKHN